MKTLALTLLLLLTGCGLTHWEGSRTLTHPGGEIEQIRASHTTVWCFSDVSRVSVQANIPELGEVEVRGSKIDAEEAAKIFSPEVLQALKIMGVL